MDNTPKELTPVPPGETVSTETPQARIRTIKTQLEKTRELRDYPKGVQYNVEGPMIPVNPNAKEGQWLGVLNVEGIGTDTVTLDYHSTSNGKAFVVKIGEDVTIEGDVDINEVAELLPPLFAKFNQFGHFIRDENAIHLGAIKNLDYFDRVTGIMKSASPRIKP